MRVVVKPDHFPRTGFAAGENRPNQNTRFVASLSHGLAVGGCNLLESLAICCDILRHEKPLAGGA
jgi:hypothetical protein